MTLSPRPHNHPPAPSPLQTRIPRSLHAQFQTKVRTASFRSLLPQNIKRYRHQHRSYSSSPSNPPITIVYATIGLCCGIYLWKLHATVQLRERKDPSIMIYFNQNMLTSLKNWDEGRWWTLVTSSFTHINLFHLGVNMYSLYSIGPMIVQVFGVYGYGLTWIGSSIACCGFSLLWDNHLKQKAAKLQDGQPLYWEERDQRQPREFRQTVSAGASGSVLGFSTALMLVAPTLTVSLFPIPVPLYLWVFNSIFAAGSTYCMLTESLPILGHAGHLGGMAGGMVCGQLLLRALLLRR